MGNMMTDGVMPSQWDHAIIIKNENRAYGSWAAHVERVALVLPQCVQLRGLRKIAKEVGVWEFVAEGIPECESGAKVE